jgi:hypothetical protein
MKNPITLLKQLVNKTKSVPKKDIVKKDENKPAPQIHKEKRKKKLSGHFKWRRTPLIAQQILDQKRKSRNSRNRMQKRSRKINRYGAYTKKAA